MNNIANVSDFFKFIIAILVSELAGIVGSVFTFPSIAGWYTGLIKPELSPPNWIFGPVWVTLYFLMGAAAFLVWEKGFGQRKVKVALSIFGVQLILNAAWSIIFFGFRNPLYAFFEIIILWLAILGTIFVFYKISKPAALLFLPYILWVSFAGFLNYNIWALNKKPAQINNFEECAAAGNMIMESYPRQCRTQDGRTFAEDIGNELEKLNLITIKSPRPNQSVESPLSVGGEARGLWFFEASFPVKIFDDNGFLLGARSALAQGGWMTEDFVPYSAVVPFAAPSTLKGKLVLEKDNPSGLPENAGELTVPVSFKEASAFSKDLMTVKIFLSDSNFANEPYFDCSRTVPVERRVPKSPGVAKASMEALLRGATEEEMSRGFFSNINSGVRINTITIDQGVARVDFDEQLEYQLGGSCRVAAIWSQITDTLKQFPTVNDIIISINGRTEDILQP